MRLPEVRFTVRSALIAVALIAAWLAVIRFVEQRNHRIAISECRFFEKQWQDAHAEATKEGEGRAASFYEAMADRSTNERRWHEGQLGRFPRTLSTGSVVATVVYVWGVILVLVVQRERSASGRTSWARIRPACFFVWLGLGLISPIAMMVLAGMYERTAPYTGSMPWPATAIGVLFWLQGVLILLGVLILRGWRWLTLGIGLLLFLATGFVALGASMAVTGVWL